MSHACLFHPPIILSFSLLKIKIMSSSEIEDSSSFSGQNMPGKAPEKSTFSRTCNLFSQYLKENPNFPDLTLGRRAPPPPPPAAATMNLFPMVETTSRAAVPQDQARTMTVFYNGQVMTFNDLGPEKVKEILKLAQQGAAQKAPKPDQPSKNVVVSGSGLPIARRASIASFLKKRNDRITARSPYKVQDVSKQDDKKTWLG